MPVEPAPALEERKPETEPGGRRSWFSSHRRPLLVALLVLALVGFVVYRVVTAGHESTDDAQIAADVVPLAVRVTAPVSKVLFRENDPVSAGQLLLVLDDTDLSAKVRQSEAELQSAEAAAEVAEAQVRVAEASARGTFFTAEAGVSGSAAEVANAQAQVAAARAAVTRAEADLRKTSIALHRAQELVAANAVPQQQLDDARAGFDAARGALDQSRAQVRAAEDERQSAADRVREAQGRFNVSRPVDAAIAVAQANVRLATAKGSSSAAQLDWAMQQLSYAHIFAPVDGTVSSLTVHPGQLVEPGQTFAILVPRATYVVANFKETQLAGLRVGQRATVHVDTYGGRKFDAYVESFSAGTGAAFSLLPPDNATGNFVKVVQRVPVRLAWVHPPGVRLATGLSVTAEVNEKAPALNLPPRNPPVVSTGSPSAVREGSP